MTSFKKTKGLKAWVTIGGFSILDSANVSSIVTTFMVYDDWDKRGAALSQDKIIANLPRESWPPLRRPWFLSWCRRLSGAWASQAASR